MIPDDLRNKLSSLDAFLAAETDDIDLAINKLAKHSDPESMRRRTVLLLKAERYDEAYTIAKTYPIDKEWVEVGIRAAILGNDYKLAEQFVYNSTTLSDSTGTLGLRCVVAFADSIVGKHFLLHSSEKHSVYTCAVEPVIQPVLQKGFDFLIPYCEAIYNRHSISSPLENEAMTILQITLALLGRRDETSRFLPLLIRRGNLNIMLGQFMAEGCLPLAEGFADVLIESNANDFYALLFAEIIRHISGNDLQTIFSSLLSLSARADDHDKRSMLYSALSGVSVEGGKSFINELELHTDTLLNLEDPIDNTRLAIHKIYQKCWKEAEAILNNHPLPEDPRWLNASARCDIAKDDLDDALPKLISSALMYKDERWLLEAADHAFQQEKHSDAIQCLECIRDYYPWNSYARKNLVSLLIEGGQLDKAIIENEYLVAASPDDKQLQVQLAFLYNRVDKTDMATAILTDLVDSDESSLDAILLLSSILQQSDNTTGAFNILEQNKEIYWDQKEFLFAYLNMGYASGNEKQASEALQALNVLREKGEIDPKLFRTASLNELTEVIQDAKERQNNLDTAIMQGKMPWTLSAEASSKTIYFDWRIRTQKLKWQAEDTASRAEFSIYSTNRFGSDVVDNRTQLTEIKSTSLHSSICVDYTALITLYELGKLHLLFSIYENIYIPEQYRLNKQKDRQRIQPHQLSHLKGYEAIRLLLDNNSITMVLNDEINNILVIDEYADNENNQNVRPLKPVIDSLSFHGKIPRSEEAALRELANRADIDGAQQISLNDKVVINLNTLMTIYRHDEKLLDILANSFRVCVSEDDKNELIRDILGFEFQKATLKKYNDLWNEISNQPNVQYVITGNNRDDEKEVNERGTALLALKIAQDKSLPFLVDDRVLQVVTINARGGVNGTSFGTDVFLESVLNKNIIGISEYSESIIQLMKWRYKFIVPKAEMLHYLATCYTGTSPGEELNITAQYIHDCMRDPGLFGGLENTDPPLSMALRLYITWTSRIGEFLALVWTDELISDQRSDAITEWVSQIMLPSVPVVIQEQVHSKVASNLPEILVVNALIRAANIRPHKRVANSLLNLSRMIGITDHRHEQLISEVISRAAG